MRVCVFLYHVYMHDERDVESGWNISPTVPPTVQPPRARGAPLLLCESARPRIVRFTVKEPEKGLARPGSTTKGEPFEKSFNVMIIIVARQKGTAKAIANWR